MNSQAAYYTKMELTRRAGALDIRIDHLGSELEAAIKERERERLAEESDDCRTESD